MKALFSILALLLINSAYAGTGEGGQIRFHNESSKTVTITFNGKGCNGLFARIYSVCEYVDVKPGQTAEYKYNGNVTSTWINVQDTNKDYWYNFEGSLIAPCADFLMPSNYCYAHDLLVKTTPYKWTDYTFKL